MTRSIVSGLLGLLSVIVVGSVPTACESGGVGDPCTPEDEYDPGFAGFKITEENIESRSFQCQTRICLVNHFQGRVSCPLGQKAPQACGPSLPGCPDGQTCVPAAEYAPDCDPGAPDQGKSQCGSGSCNANGRYCECQDRTDCPPDGEWFCDEDRRCKSFVCKAAGCQRADATEAENKNGDVPKPCCVPGTDTPIISPVCGQCEVGKTRSAAEAVYCSCRCGVAPGEPEDPNFNFCECPTGFSCEVIRPNVGLGDPNITGKYCIKQGSGYVNESQCGGVVGELPPGQCEGQPL